MLPLYDLTAQKRTVSVTVNGDLYVKAKEAGLDVSGIVEAALVEGLKRKNKEAIRAEIAAEMAALNAFEAEHGSFADMVRKHLKTCDPNDAA